jgi:hypothetical protein
VRCTGDRLSYLPVSSLVCIAALSLNGSGPCNEANDTKGIGFYSAFSWPVWALLCWLVTHLSIRACEV